ncbi:hypothetical protein TSUD_292060 [Trifolium subterraneum]|uniref:Uncharacterized protein n=1 Tax=Trifolium subterraneum TaxID=3900 RepID=A0A1B5Z906_TRISU|nr:hypothetical protein TSUD_292060 [Trifolium subterraneum]
MTCSSVKARNVGAVNGDNEDILKTPTAGLQVCSDIILSCGGVNGGTGSVFRSDAKKNPLDKIKNKSFIRISLSSSSLLSSFGLDLPPIKVESSTAQLKGRGVGNQNYKKPLLFSSSKHLCAHICNQVVDEERVLAFVEVQEKDPSISPSIHQGVSGNPPSLFSIGYVHFDGNPTPLPEGVEGFQDFDLIVQLGESPSPISHQLVPLESYLPERSSVLNTSNIAKKI